MKKLIVALAILGFSASALASEIYFIAPETKIENVKNPGTFNTEVKLSYQLPCWAEKVDTINKTVILGSPMNPASDFEVVLGILLKGNNMSPCVGSNPAEETLNLNTIAIEGSFSGFKLIENLL